jgi:5-(carboxyamino)imidazole ribonucleotide synthase
VRAILPGATVGVLGGGQLGRMLALAARAMGYRVRVYSPEAGGPAGAVADREHVGVYDDLDAVHAFAREVDVVTFEFENVAAEAAAAAAEHTPVRPAGRVLHVCQNRLREKGFLSGAGFPVVPFRAVRSASELRAALDELTGASLLGAKAVLKTSGWGYDGKGQEVLSPAADAAEAWLHLFPEASLRTLPEASLRLDDAPEAILEAFVDFEREISVVAARGLDGSMATYGPVANDHRHHVLDLSVAPAPVPPALAAEARELAEAVLHELEVVGVLCVEMFVTRDGRLLINELAPRPHNSGHYTIDACVTSQFEQQLRAVCGLPLGSTAQHRPAAMANLLGDLWDGGEPDWAAALALPDVKLHLYGKAAPRPRRKMGHLTALADDGEIARRRVLAARAALTGNRAGRRAG